MSDKKYINLKVVGFEPELAEFLNVCSVIQKFGWHGAHRKLIVDVDGDGSGKLRFYLNDDEEELPMTDEPLSDTPPILSIGE